MQVKNIEGLSTEQLKDLVKQGGKFVFFTYTVSILVRTFRRSSAIYFIRPGEGTFRYHAGSTALTAIMGWWGIPWGPIYSIGCLFSNFSGGKDVTTEIANQLGLNSHDGYNVGGSNTVTSATSSASGYNIPGTGSSTATTSNTGNGGYNIPR